MYKIIGNDGKEYGPVSADQICQWIASGRCGAQTLAQPEGGKSWQPLSSHPEFAATIGNAIPTPPPPLLKGQPVKSINPLMIVGIVLGVIFVGIVLIGVFAAIAIPNFVRGRQQAQANQCENNLKQLAAAIRVYSTNHQDQLPSAATWSDAISNNVSSVSLFQCPADPGQTCSYAFNKQLDGRKLSEVNPLTILLYESDAGWNGTATETEVTSRGHPAPASNGRGIMADEMFHVVLADGSFASIPASGLSALRWEP
ncbi:MAG: domain containing protein [Verrucomicrobiales bacterium]|nr:domain containing protein [Verrucomicrobiales bacterium]